MRPRCKAAILSNFAVSNVETCEYVHNSDANTLADAAYDTFANTSSNAFVNKFNFPRTNTNTNSKAIALANAIALAIALALANAIALTFTNADNTFADADNTFANSTIANTIADIDVEDTNSTDRHEQHNNPNDLNQYEIDSVTDNDLRSLIASSDDSRFGANNNNNKFIVNIIVNIVVIIFFIVVNVITVNIHKHS
jgi:hypothetical protein